MKVTLLFFYLMVFTHFTQAQITVTGSDEVASESNTTLTLSYTVPAGVDRLLLVSVGTDLIPTSVTYAGNLMTVQGGGTNVWTTALGSGVAETGDIVFTVGASAFFMGINAISFSGVDQTTPVDNYLEGEIGIGETSTDVTITSRADDLVYDGVIVGCFSTNCGSPPIATPNLGQTLQNDLSFIGSLFTGRGATSTKAGALFVHVGWTFSGSFIGAPGLHVGLNIRNSIGALPVELSSFSLRKQNDRVLVAWETQSEINNEGFEIERSLDGRVFEKIGFISGEGSTTQVQRYEFMDKNPPEGILYFRLKQIDFDGAFEYSEVQTIQVDHTRFKVFPNPVADRVNIDLPGNEEAIIHIYDQTGKLVKLIEWKEEQQSVDLSDLPKGVFVMEINVQDRLLIERLVKL